MKSLVIFGAGDIAELAHFYFEKDTDLFNRNYVGWRKGDLWLDANKEVDIDNKSKIVKQKI